MAKMRKNKRKLKLKKQVKILGIGLLLLLSGIVIFKPSKTYNVNKVNISEYANVNYDHSKHIYLSDIDYVETLNNTKVSYAKDSYDIHFDKNDGGQLLSLNVEGNTKTFIKGISAWATSSLVYDLEDIQKKENTTYDYFTAYLGVDASQVNTYFNSGVVFTISTSTDGENWTEKEKTGVLKGWDNAVFVKVDLNGAKYLKLYAYQNGGNWWDHWYDDALYADAKLVTKDYTEKNVVNENVKPLSEYDEEIKKYVADGAKLEKYKSLLLKRELVKRADYNILQALMNYSEDYTEIINWLMNDEEILYLFLLGGEPDGNYVSALKILDQLYKAYHEDLKDKENGDLYLKMMVSLSLTHSARVGSWITGAPEDPDNPNGSNALKRYQIFKQLYNENLLNKDIFTNISVEEMRFVMNNIISDEEIIWLNHYTRDYAKKNNFTEQQLKDEKEKNPYTYITYTFGYDYSEEQYYNSNNKAKWDDKYSLSKYGLSYHEEKGYPKLWVVFEEGSVCGGLSKTGSNIRGAYGIPSSVVSQPGHAAYIYMSMDKNHNKIWNLYNDVSGWGQSGKTEKLSTRMPLGWGSGEYANDFPASYVLLAQAALNEYDTYAQAEEILMLTDVYSNNLDELEKIYRDALNVENINLDAWYGLVKLYEKKNASVSEYYKLAQEIIKNLNYYPRAMYDLVSLIEEHIPKKSGDLANLKQSVRNALERASKATDKEVLQPGPCQAVAKYLLNQFDPLATFSFDGEKANTIVLSSTFEGNKWQYSLDGGQKWVDTDLQEVKLSSEEIQKIHEDTDILVRIYGALDSTFGIDIKKPNKPTGLDANDLENKVIGTNNTMEWRIDGDSTWTSYSNEEPDLSGDKVVYVRTSYTGVNIASEEEKFTFTNDETNEEKSYVPLSRLSIYEISSEQNTTSDASKNALDGNRNTIWHTKWDKSDKKLFFTIKLDSPTYLSALEYLPRQDATNGRVLSAKISVSLDGENYTTVVDGTDWKNDASKKIANFEESVKAEYIKIEGVKTSGEFMSAAMFELFEDKTKLSTPTAGLEYSTTEKTNKNVTVKLVNPSKEIKITNNNGSNTYTFTENGSFTFEFVDNYGNAGSTTATVNWIDKVAPNAQIVYSITNPTTGEVVAKLTSKENITILNNSGKDTYTFFKNGSFTFEYQDEVGNKNTTVATVDWIITKSSENTMKSVATTLPNNNISTNLPNNTSKNTNNSLSNKNSQNTVLNENENLEESETEETIENIDNAEEQTVNDLEIENEEEDVKNETKTSATSKNNTGKIIFGALGSAIIVATIFLGIKIAKLK